MLFQERLCFVRRIQSVDEPTQGLDLVQLPNLPQVIRSTRDDDRKWYVEKSGVDVRDKERLRESFVRQYRLEQQILISVTLPTQRSMTPWQTR